jgi:hypothetical protein
MRGWVSHAASLDARRGAGNSGAKGEGAGNRKWNASAKRTRYLRSSAATPATQLEGGAMGYSVRFYLFTEEGIFRIAQRVVEGLVHGSDAIPKYAGSTQKAATITVESADDGVARIVEAVGEFWRFDEVGQIHRSLREAGWRAAESFPNRSPSGDEAVVDLGPKLKRKKWEKENRWI